MADISIANIFKTEQLSQKQSWWVSSTKGKRKITVSCPLNVKVITESSFEHKNYIESHTTVIFENN